MQLRNSICAILLLTVAQVAFATLKYAGDGRHRHMKASSKITKRTNVFVVGFPPRIKPVPAVQPEKQPLEKRQLFCPVGSFKCSDGLGCCTIGTVCTEILGVLGCCPLGSECGMTFDCSPSEVDCFSYCCPSGTTCSMDTQGDPGCTYDTGGSGTDILICGVDGYVPCTNMDGCCPIGVKCIPPTFCNIPCGADDPICGDGCCPKGLVCLLDNTCGPGDGAFTPLVSTTSTKTITESLSKPEKPTPETTHKTTSKKSTSKKPTPEDTVTGTSSEPTSESSQKTSTRSTVYTYVTAITNNDAPLRTMDAMLGGALGIAAGYLAI